MASASAVKFAILFTFVASCTTISRCFALVGHDTHAKAEHHPIFKRQVSYPELPKPPTEAGLFGPQLQQQQQQQQQQQSGLMKLISDLGPQTDSSSKAVVTSLLQTISGQSQQAGPQSAINPAQMMRQLSEMIRSTQARNARSFETAEQTGQQTLRQAQSGIQSALSEIGSGLQRIAANNPNLIPDIKNLYQSVSTRLSSASSNLSQAVSPPKNGVEQFTEQLVKAGQS